MKQTALERLRTALSEVSPARIVILLAGALVLLSLASGLFA